MFLHLPGGHNEQAPGHGHPTGGGVPRSRTVPPQEPIFTNALKSASTLELERRAKVEAERAAKVRQTIDHKKDVFQLFSVFSSLFFRSEPQSVHDHRAVPHSTETAAKARLG